MMLGGIIPVAHYFDDAMAQHVGLEDAAVEEDRVGCLPRSVFFQERGEMTRNRWVVDVRQAHLVQTTACAAAGFRVACDFGEEAVEDQLANIGRRDRRV